MPETANENGFVDLTRPRQIKVAIGTPTAGGGELAYFQSIMGLFGHSNPEHVLLRFIPCTGSNIAENQNTIVQGAESAGADFVLLVENDMAFPKDALVRLLAHDKDIIGATYPFKDHDLLAKLLAGHDLPLRYMGKEIDGENVTYETLAKRPDQVRPVQFVPMGFTLIRLSALNKVRDWLSEQANSPERKRHPAFFHNVIYVSDSERGIVTTTDSTFCFAARAAGLDVWMDAVLSLQMEHIGKCNFGLLPPAAETDKAA